MIAFKPMLTPREMFEKGVFGGAYFGPNAGPDMSRELADVLAEEFKGLDSDLWCAERYLPRRNKFRIRSGLNYEQWMKYRWIHKQDPYGWLNWYLQHNRGRRTADDDRQISRHQSFCGPKGRWRNNIYQKIHDTGDWHTAPRVQQSLLHWAYEVNEHDYDTWLTKKWRNVLPSKGETFKICLS